MRLATPIAILALLAALLAGCGGSSSPESSGADSTAPLQAGTPTAPDGASAKSCGTGAWEVADLRATATSCEEARQVAAGWLRARECVKRPGASRSPCSLLSYRCVAAATDRGWSVSCSKPGRSIAFTFPR